MSTERPRLSVVGTGYLGATHAVCMAELGYEVIGMDVDPTKIEQLRAGRGAVLRARAARAARASTSTAGGCGSPRPTPRSRDFADVHFVCVGTPQQNGRVRRRPDATSTRRVRRWRRT